MKEKFDVKTFLQQYFQFHHCDIKIQDDDVWEIPLTKELDLALMNRPFYWHYVEAMGVEGEPLQLKLTFKPQMAERNVEWVHIGSPIMEKIKKHLEASCRFTRLYEDVQTNTQAMLHPWLVLNMILRYKGTILKEELISLGLNLINGTFKLDMMEQLMEKNFTHQITAYCYKISPLIKLPSAYNRIASYIQTYVMQGDLTWIKESEQRLQSELALLEKYYANDEDDEWFAKEKTDLINRLQPTISLEIFNGGIFYLQV